MKKWEFLELAYSKSIHAKGIPVLLSPLVLRSYGCGQVDLALMKKIYSNWVIELYEVKTSGIIGTKQKNRLKNAARFVSMILEANVFVKIV